MARRSPWASHSPRAPAQARLELTACQISRSAELEQRTRQLALCSSLLARWLATSRVTLWVGAALAPPTSVLLTASTFGHALNRGHRRSRHLSFSLDAKPVQPTSNATRYFVLYIRVWIMQRHCSGPETQTSVRLIDLAHATSSCRTSWPHGHKECLSYIAHTEAILLCQSCADSDIRASFCQQRYRVEAFVLGSECPEMDRQCRLTPDVSVHAHGVLRRCMCRSCQGFRVDL